MCSFGHCRTMCHTDDQIGQLDAAPISISHTEISISREIFAYILYRSTAELHAELIRFHPCGVYFIQFCIFDNARTTNMRGKCLLKHKLYCSTTYSTA